MTTQKNKICTECIKEFNPKEIFIATKPNDVFYTLYCGKCVEDLNITDLKPYVKPRKKREKKEVI